jgi:hypothetical protein
VTKIFQSGQPSHGGGGKIFEMMSAILPKGIVVCPFVLFFWSL